MIKIQLINFEFIKINSRLDVFHSSNVNSSVSKVPLNRLVLKILKTVFHFYVNYIKME